MRILVLGGTTEARELANRLVDDGHEVVTSLAGRTSDPMRPRGALRVGKFGGVSGLVAYLKASAIDRLVDATHPYAGLISTNAVAAAKATGVPLVRLMRPAWGRPAGADWVDVDGFGAAERALPSGAEVLLTTGHEGLDEFIERDDCSFLVRLIEAPDFALPPHMKLVLARPPYSVEGEMMLMRQNHVSYLVTKNSGGTQTVAKIEAARRLGVTVVILKRPNYGPATEVATVEDAIVALAL